MRKTYLQLLTAAALVSVGIMASAEVYRWIDATGAVHYSDRPTSEKATEVKVKSKRTDYAALAQARQDRLDLEQAEAADAAVREEIDAENRANRQIRAENCRRAKEALRSVQQAQRLYVPDENGERRYLSEVEIAQRISQAKKDVDDWCNAN